MKELLFCFCCFVSSSIFPFKMKATWRTWVFSFGKLTHCTVRTRTAPWFPPNAKSQKVDWLCWLPARHLWAPSEQAELSLISSSWEKHTGDQQHLWPTFKLHWSTHSVVVVQKKKHLYFEIFLTIIIYWAHSALQTSGTIKLAHKWPSHLNTDKESYQMYQNKTKQK